MRWFIGYTIAICTLLIVISQSIIFPTFFMPFFSWQYNRLDTAYNMQMEKDELMRVTGELLDYMRGRRYSLEDVTGVVAGEYRLFFSDIEIRHMIDVLELYNIAFIIRNVAFFLIIGLTLCLVLLKHEVIFTIARALRDVFIAFLAALFLLMAIIAINFSRAFDIFHEIFFNNDYWILNPRVDLLINMVPLGFFIHISIFIALLLIVSSGLIILFSILYIRSRPKTGRLLL